MAGNPVFPALMGNAHGGVFSTGGEQNCFSSAGDLDRSDEGDQGVQDEAAKTEKAGEFVSPSFDRIEQIYF
jgi:hypothetical protein